MPESSPNDARRQRIRIVTTIDIHSHIVDRGYLASLRAAAGLDVHDEDGKTFLRHNGNAVAWWREEMFDVSARLARMDALGIDVRVLSLSTPNVYSWPASQQPEIARNINDRLAAMCNAHPERFVGLASLPLGDIPAALAELDRATGTLGLRGAAIGSNVAGVDLDDPRFEPLWARFNRLRIPVFMHPMFPPPSERMSGFELPLRLGLPFDTTLALTRLIYGGVLERYPDVVLIAAHTGGTLVPLLERLDNGYRIFPECRRFISQLPSVYARRLYYDTASFSPPLLRMAIDAVGIGQLLLATDDPFIGSDLAHVEALSLSSTERHAVLGGNASRLLDWSAP
jgi:aminocarboxymuconate-semialdehyde decarboxylase